MNWNILFTGKSPEQLVDILQKLFLELMNKFIPNKIKKINYKDAPWVTPAVKTALRRNKRVFKKWIERGRILDEKERVNKIQYETNKIIINAKNKYTSDLAKKNCDSNTGSKCFWTAFNTLVNKKKITNIPPILEKEKYISNFKDKAEIFNNYFALQCRPLDIESSLPPLNFLSSNQLKHISIDPVNIASIIKKLNSKKANGFDQISIVMLKLCPEEVSVPLSIIFNACLQKGIFPHQWKKANIQPVHKKIADN